ncbi:peptidylprolyl isomerase [Erysipelotrichaceae bacterium 66-17]|nr:peptidylprolyl isomerase [uncultured Dubosiella sp.]
MNSKNKNVWIWGLVIAVIVIGAVFFFLPHKQTTEASSLDLSKTYIADIVVKDYGTIEVELDPKEAPLTCENFIELANEGFYDNLTFHRIMKGFMIQGGDPNGDGTGGSEKTVKGEFSSNGIENSLSHERGVISMARSSDKDSASSQFFICDADDPFLDGDYAAFGKVIKGMDVVDKIADDAKPTDNNGSISKDEQPVIETITIKEQ